MLNGMPRFIILEHTAAPDDPTGRHFDLLLEAGDACRTWRLPEIPLPGTPPLAAVELAPHRLAWLDHEAGEVSGGRGFARRIDAGTYEIVPPEAAEMPQAQEFAVTLTGRASRWPLKCTRHGETWTIAAGAERFPQVAPGR